VVLELDSDWSPVVVVVLLLSDWLPVDVVLSIVRFERPFSVMSGVKLEVEPLTELFTSDVEPVMDELWLEVEPLTLGLAVAEPETEPLVPEVEPLVPEASDPDLELLTLPEVVASLSGVQSWNTGLDECSFALPFWVFANLPAFGFLKLLHSGLLVLAVVLLVPVVAERFVALVPLIALCDVVAFVPLVAFDVVSGIELLLVAAMAGASAPITAAARMLRVREMVLMRSPPSIVWKQGTHQVRQAPERGVAAVPVETKARRRGAGTRATTSSCNRNALRLPPSGDCGKIPTPDARPARNKLRSQDK